MLWMPSRWITESGDLEDNRHVMERRLLTAVSVPIDDRE